MLGGAAEGAVPSDRPITLPNTRPIRHHLAMHAIENCPGGMVAAIAIATAPQSAPATTIGAAAVDLCSVACGRLDGFWELGLSPWDMAAGSLLISEAGGAELTRTVEVLRMLRTRHRELYSRISEIWPVAPRGFAVYDRSLGAVVDGAVRDVAKMRAMGFPVFARGAKAEEATAAGADERRPCHPRGCPPVDRDPPRAVYGALVGHFRVAREFEHHRVVRRVHDRHVADRHR